MARSRRRTGDETHERLLNWTKDQKASERLAAHILKADGYISVDPVHPLGGPDQRMDIICIRDNRRWIGASYFPRGQKPYREVKRKFLGDLEGGVKNKVCGIAFVTNQKITLSNRVALGSLAAEKNIESDLYHLDRITQILNNPTCYGIRLEYLDIDMEKEEQLAFFAHIGQIVEGLGKRLDTFIKQNTGSTNRRIPLQEIREFRDILNSISGMYLHPFCFSTGGMDGIYNAPQARIQDLRVPLAELREFTDILSRITGNQRLDQSTIYVGSRISNLHVPLKEIRECEERCNRIVEKLRAVKALSSSIKA